MKTKITLWILLCLITEMAHSQPFIGLNTSNYAGIYRAFYNPSAIAGTKMKYQLNLVTLNSTINNRYFKYFASDALLHPIENAYTAKEIYGKSKLTGTFTQGQNMNVWSEVVGPSGFVGLGKQQLMSLGFSTRLRGFIQGINQPQIMSDVYTKRLDFGALAASQGVFANYTVSQFSFFETAITSAFAFKFTDWLAIKAGASAKYYSAGRRVFMNLKNAQYQLRIINKEEAQLDLSNVSYQYGFTNKVQSFALGGKGYGSGLGLDAGVTLEIGKIRNDADYRSNYIIRLAAAITDAGSIGFNDNNVYQYSGTISKITLDQAKIIELGDNAAASLEKTFGTKNRVATSGYTLKLPTTINIDADVHLAKSFFLNAALYKPVPQAQNVAVISPQIISITPRFEDQDAQFTLPISWVEGNKAPTIGFSVRLGPAFIGFSNFSGMLKIHEPRGTFAYIGFQLFGFNNEEKE